MGRQEAGDKTHRRVLPSFAFRQIYFALTRLLKIEHWREKCFQASLFLSRDCLGRRLSHFEDKDDVEHSELRSSSSKESLKELRL